MPKIDAVRFEYSGKDDTNTTRWQAYSNNPSPWQLERNNGIIGVFQWSKDERYWMFCVDDSYIFIEDEWKEIMKFWKKLNKEKGI